MSKGQVKCDKQSFWTKGEAIQRVTQITLNSTGKIPTRAYRCGRCPFYHLTSQDLRDGYTRDTMMQKVHEFEKAVRALARQKAARTLLHDSVDMETAITESKDTLDRLRTDLEAFIAEALPEAAP